jgi:hypothetical protein
MGCVSADDLVAFMEGQLQPAVEEEVEEHVEGCEACRELLAETTRAAFPEPPPEVAQEGRFGRYEIVRPIGAGGMGVVYAARDPKLHRMVALKMLRPSGAGGAAPPELRERILREARAMARLSHPNVLALYDVGELGDQVFLAMELVEGSTLTAWLGGGAGLDRDGADPVGEEAAIPKAEALAARRGWREVLEVFLAAARGLAAAHAAGLVHRDFKPDNVLIGNDGRVRVTDFGLARAAAPGPPRDEPAPALAGQPEQLALSLQRSVLAGSPAYMAPEQMRGEMVSARSDLFGFSVALYEGLYGERPFPGETSAELERAIERGEMRPPPKGVRVPARVRRVLVRGLRAAPAERFESMDAIIAALERARRSARLATAAAIAGGLAVVSVVAALFRLSAATSRMAVGAGAGARAQKTELGDEIDHVLWQMEADSDPARLAKADRRLEQLVADAQRALDELRKRGGSAPALSSTGDQLDLDIRRILKTFGAETYVVPPIFKERLRYHIARILKRPDLQAIYQRKKKYWPVISKELTALGLPQEMGYVVWAESLFDPTARSDSGSLGLWQFQARSARNYGLRVDEQVDERTDVAKCTRAAARYLADMLSEFGSDSFMLALASYNSGEKKIRRALHELAQEPGGYGKDKRDFWHLYRRKMLSEETREYVPTVLAASLIGSNPERYGLE